jgi:hypothetical protein
VTMTPEGPQSMPLLDRGQVTTGPVLVVSVH